MSRPARDPGDHDRAALGDRVSAARAAAEARGETFYPGASRVHLPPSPEGTLG